MRAHHSNVAMLVAIPLALVAYLIGGVPTAYLLGRWLRGVDIRTLGSRNVGAVNAFKQLGWRIGLLVLAVDVGKGAVLTLLASAAGIGDWGVFGVVVAATVGNNWSPYLRLSGGKGLALVFGISLVMVPLLSIAALPFTAVGFFITRSVIWAFVTGAVALNALVIVGDHATPVVVTCLALTAIVVVTHLVRSMPNTRLAIRNRDIRLFGQAE